MKKFEKLDNEQKELVKYWIEKFLGNAFKTTETKAFIEKHLTPEPVIEVGKWYKSNSGHLFFTEKETTDKTEPFIAYGFTSNGEWTDSDPRMFSKNLGWEEATPEEVEQRLFEYAKSKGYKNGNYICACTPDMHTKNVKEHIYYDRKLNDVIHGEESRGNFLMHQGKWAEIIDEKAEIRESVARLEAELQELKSKL